MYKERTLSDQCGLGQSAHLKFLTKSSPEAGPDVRVLLVANGLIPTLQLSFIKPLAPYIDSGDVITEVLTEGEMNGRLGHFIRRFKIFRWVGSQLVRLWPTGLCRRINTRFAAFRPTVVVFCRYSGPYVERILELARNANVPTVFHIDDDLLNVPIEIGKRKYEYHNDPARLATVRYLLNNVDLIYCSTEPLKQRIESYGLQNRVHAGQIYCSGKVMAPAVVRPVTKIGYMGFDHAHDFELVIPALIQLLRRYPAVQFEIFGSIPKPSSLDEFGDRIRVIPPVPRYEEFMKKFALLRWDIGLCPLADTPFNAVKANTKWVEYTSVGAAVIATAGTIYDECCSEGRGLLAATEQDWLASLEALVCDPELRFNLVNKAQQHLTQEYGIDRLREQVIDVLRQATLEAAK
jgi:glycosyltransferase involved in cell wall biosynthesis